MLHTVTSRRACCLQVPEFHLCILLGSINERLDNEAVLRDQEIVQESPSLSQKTLQILLKMFGTSALNNAVCVITISTKTQIIIKIILIKWKSLCNMLESLTHLNLRYFVLVIMNYWLKTFTSCWLAHYTWVRILSPSWTVMQYIKIKIRIWL